MKPRVRVISVGGTISSSSADNGSARPAYAGEEIVESAPGVEKHATIEVGNFSKMLSSQLSVEQVFQLGRKIHDLLEEDSDLSGVVVTHGTGTIEESAFMTDLMVNDERPVVFTGSMRPMSDPFTDAPFNLFNAVRIAASSEAIGKGTMVALNSRIHPAREVYKSHSTNVDTFQSGEFGPLGYAYPDRIHFARAPLLRNHLYTENPVLNVDLIKFVVGMDDRFIKVSVASGAKGIVIEGSGLGNVNEKVAEGIEYALSQGVHVAVASRCTDGRVFPSYGTKGGGSSLLEKGCLLTSMPGPKARIMMMLSLGQNASHEQMQKWFDPMAG